MRVALKRLFCYKLVDCCFDLDNDEFDARCSVEHLSFVKTPLESLLEDQYFHGTFPLMRRLRISNPGDDDSFRYSSLSDLVESATGQLHHLSFVNRNEAVNPYAQQCSELRSLTCSQYDTPIHGSHYSGAALFSLRMDNYIVPPISTLVESLESFHSSGMIDSASTVVFLLGLASSEHLDGTEELREWARQKGLRLEYYDGDLAQSLKGGSFGEEDGFTKYADWVDAEHARRTAARAGRE